MKINEFLTKKNMICLMVCIGIIQVACYYMADALAHDGPGLAIPQPDTLLYVQAARRIVEGHAFSFSAGEAVSTGTTTVLYPFILAIPYALGATGDALFTAGFALNAFFYLISLVCWGVIIWTLLKDSWARALAAAVISLSGYVASNALGQSDIGCWLAASSVFVAGLVTGKFWIYAPALLIAPWLRPEGVFCVIALIMVLAIFLALHIKGSTTENGGLLAKREFLLVLLAVLSIGGVFLLNYLLTGKPGFSSVAQKGHFKLYPFGLAVQMTAIDGLRMMKTYLCGLPARAPRDFFLPPVLGALFLWVGICLHDWRRPENRRLLVWLVAIAGGFLSVALSGWQDTNLDRYLAWMMPVFLLFAAAGAVELGKRIPADRLRAIPAAILLLFTAVFSFVLCAIHHDTSTSSDQNRVFAKEARAFLPPGAAIGGWGGCDLAYDLPSNRIASISAIYSPEFSARSFAGRFAILKNEPATRFDYWYFENADQSGSNINGLDVSILCREDEALPGMDWRTLKKADWTPLDRALVPTLAPTGMSLRAQVDVGYDRSEDAAGYRAESRYAHYVIEPFVKQDLLAGKPTIDTGRAIIGWDGMNVPLIPGKDAAIVMRTLPKCRVDTINGVTIGKQDVTLKNPLALRIHVDGQDAGLASVAYATNGFSDVQFRIPGPVITRSPCHVEFFGDHLACGYWFYQ